MIVSPETLYLGGVSNWYWCKEEVITYGLLSWFGVPAPLLVDVVIAP